MEEETTVVAPEEVVETPTEETEAASEVVTAE